MDTSARWFLAGIIVSLINTGLVIVFIGIPGITDDNDSASTADSSVNRTFVLVVDEDGQVVSQRTELGGASGAASGGAGTTAVGEDGAMADSEATSLLGLGEPTIAEVDGPSFLAARDGTAYVATRRFELMSVDLEGDVSDESLDGIEDLGASRVLDVDVTEDGTLYLLVSDGPLEWRLFLRPDGEGDWELATSGDDVGWPADVVALSVTDGGAIYVSASDPAGIFRVEPDFELARSWVGNRVVVGLDTAADDSRLLYAAPETVPERPADQLQQVRSGRVSTWGSTYQGCGEGAAVLVPQLPRDVAIVANTSGGSDTALVVDSLNHVVWYQEHLGEGQVLFGTPCERGDDDGHLSTPRGVAIDEDGNVFIADTANDRVIVLERVSPLPADEAAVVDEVATAEGVAEEAATEPATTIQFGIPEACAEGVRCAEADRIDPRTVVVAAGDAVRFDIRAISHQVAIYGPGTRPENIDRTALGGVAETPGANNVLISAANRIAVSPTLPFETPPATEWDWDTSDLEPGTYLLLCTFVNHFDLGMYGFAVVE